MFFSYKIPIVDSRFRRGFMRCAGAFWREVRALQNDLVLQNTGNTPFALIADPSLKRDRGTAQLQICLRNEQNSGFLLSRGARMETLFFKNNVSMRAFFLLVLLMPIVLPTRHEMRCKTKA